MINNIRNVVHGATTPNYSNALESISMTIYSRKNPPVGYYVYAYLRLDGSPYYLGKGYGKRAWNLHENIKRPKYRYIIILEQGLTEIGALALERRYIRWYGRKDLGTGILRNRTDGGEGTSGLDPWNKGLKLPGHGGRKKGTKWSAEERKVQLDSRSDPTYYSYLKDPVRCAKISDAQRGRAGTSTGKVWYNDGIKEHYGDVVPDGFTKGRLINNSSKIGMRWFNDGLINKQYRQGEEPKGYVSGRVIKK
jgi:hypothetical protein